MNLDKAIRQRKSIKKFSNKKPNWRNIIEAIDAARFAPMSGNLFSLKFILVSNPEKIEKLAEASQQGFVSGAQYIVVVCSSPSKTLNSYEDKGEVFLRQQSGAAIQNFLLKIEDLGLSTCWIGHFVKDQVKSILKIPENVNVEAFFPIGYEFKTTRGKRKIGLDPILYFDQYKNKRMKK